MYGIADLYKCEITIPVAFSATAESIDGLESRVRRRCRDAFRDSRLLQRIIPDIQRALGAAKFDAEPDFDADAAAPGWLWDYERGGVRGGVNRADDAAPATLDEPPSPAEEPAEEGDDPPKEER